MKGDHQSDNGQKRGFFVVVDGTDGSGKTTQVELLVKRAQEEGFKVSVFDFPQYGSPSAWFVEQYLNGKFGSLDEVGPYEAAVFYAVDRDATKREIKDALQAGRLVISNRYVTANMGHQGAKIKDKDKRQKFFQWLDKFEYEILGIPRPDLNIILHVPAEIAQSLVDKKGYRGYVGGKKRDLHESNLEHLKLAEQVYLQMADEFSHFSLIECFVSGKLLSPKEIHAKIWQLVLEKIK